MVTFVKGFMRVTKMTMRIDLLVDRLVFCFALLLVSRLTLLVILRAALVLIPAKNHSSIAPLSNWFPHLYRNVSSIKIAVVWLDLLGFALVFVDSLAFGIGDCFTLLLVGLQRGCQMSTREFSNNI